MAGAARADRGGTGLEGMAGRAGGGVEDDLDCEHLIDEHGPNALPQSALAWPRVSDFDGDLNRTDPAGFQACCGQAVAGTREKADLSGDGLIHANDVPSFVEHLESP